MNTAQKIEALSLAAKRLSLHTAKLSDAYYYSSISLCLVDAIFSIGVRYKAVERVVSRVVAAADIIPDRRHVAEDPLPLDTFLALLAESPAANLLGNIQRTSSRNGILKTEAVCLTANNLLRSGIRTRTDYRTAGPDLLNCAEMGHRLINGQRSGISWMYFQMLAGDEQQVKPDRHILRFVRKATDEDVTPREAAALVQASADALVSDFPQMTPRLLDHEIWKHEAAQKSATGDKRSGQVDSC